MPDPPAPEAAIERLNAALPLQQRSALQYTLAAGSLTGLELQAVTGRLFAFVGAGLAGARRPAASRYARWRRSATTTATPPAGCGRCTSRRPRPSRRSRT